MNRFSMRYLGTGSKGNSCLIKVGDTSVLIDAGVNPADFPRDIMVSDIDAVVVSHSHLDHSRYVRELSNRYQIPVYSTPKVLNRGIVPGHLAKRIDGYFVVGSMTFVPFLVMHDSDEDSYAFMIRNDETDRTLLFIPECGTLPTQKLPSIDFMAIEGNYDENSINDSLKDGKIEIGLYNRITNPFGHLEIKDTISYIEEHKPHYAIIHNMSSNNLDRSIGLPDKTVFAEVGREYVL